MKTSPIKTLSAEAAATFVLLFLGCGSILFFEGWQLADLWIGLSFGVAVLLGIVLFGRISGAHMNPAVTLALTTAGEFDRRSIVGYILAQSFGAVAALLVLRFIYPDSPHLGETFAKSPLGENALLWAFVLEFLLTFGLMAMVLWCVRQKFGVWKSALLIGGTVALEATFFGWLTGASMNPIRSLAPALVSGNLDDLWLYLIAPTLGAGVAVRGCRVAVGSNCCVGGCPTSPAT